MLKKSLAGGISNPCIDECYERARRYGALGGKILGAGGGGFLLLYAHDGVPRLDRLGSVRAVAHTSSASNPREARSFMSRKDNAPLPAAEPHESARPAAPPMKLLYITVTMPFGSRGAVFHPRSSGDGAAGLPTPARAALTRGEGKQPGLPGTCGAGPVAAARSAAKSWPPPWGSCCATRSARSPGWLGCSAAAT